jgi:hypothetical protein
MARERSRQREKGNPAKDSLGVHHRSSKRRLEPVDVVTGCGERNGNPALCVMPTDIGSTIAIDVEHFLRGFSQASPESGCGRR